MKPKRIRWLALLGALTMTVAACGGGTEETAATAPASTMSEMSDGSMAEGGMEDMEGMEDHEHEHGEGRVWTGSDVPTVDVSITGDAESGWTVTATIGDTFRFGSVDIVTHEDGVGHAHLVIDGHVHQMLYEPSATIDALEPGMHTIEILLAASDHSDYMLDGTIIGGMAMIEVAGTVVEADVMIMASSSKTEWSPLTPNGST